MKVRIEVDTKTFVRFWLVVIGFGVAVMAIYSAREALMLVGSALFLALALNMPVKKIASWLPGKSRLGATFLSFAAIVALISAVIWFVVPPIVQQSAKFAETIPSLVDQANNQWHGLSEFIDKNNLRPQLTGLMSTIKNQASSWTANFSINIINGIGSVANFVFSAFLVLVMTFLMLLEGPMWMQRLWGIYNDKEKMEHHKSLVDKTYNVVTGYITGQLTVSGIGALCAGMFVFGMSFFVNEISASLAMPVILMVFLLTLIPMFGATIAGVIVGLMLMINSVPAGIMYVVYFIVYQQIENNFIAPIIQAKKVELSALTILVSVTIGLYMAGLVGGLLAIPLAGTLKVFFDDYLVRAKLRRLESEKPLAKLAKKLKRAE